MTEQNMTNWVQEEKAELGTPIETVFEKLPALKLLENKVTEITIDFSKKFDVWNTIDLKGNPVKKAIIPVMHNGIKMNFWLNKKNPIYRELLEMAEGKTELTVKVMATGQKEKTKYIVVK